MQTDDQDAAAARLHELRHRYRNSLQIINSLVGLHARGVADPTAARAFADLRSRVSILSTIFMDLDEEGEQVDLAAFLPRIAHRASNLQAVDVVCPLRIETIAAHMEKTRAGILGQILAEMLMDAYRACPDDTGGRAIDVRLSDEGGGRLALTVGADGAPAPAAEGATKLSQAIIKSMATTLEATFSPPQDDCAARLTFSSTN